MSLLSEEKKDSDENVVQSIFLGADFTMSSHKKIPARMYMQGSVYPSYSPFLPNQDEQSGSK
jgi:hypothetical protein